MLLTVSTGQSLCLSGYFLVIGIEGNGVLIGSPFCIECFTSGGAFVDFCDLLFIFGIGIPAFEGVAFTGWIF